MKVFTRVDGDTTKATIAIFFREFKRDSKRAYLFSTLIPFGYFLYIVLIPLLMSFIIQSLVLQPNDLYAPAWLIGGIILASAGTILAHNRGYKLLFNHEEYVTTRLNDFALSSLLSRSHTFFANAKAGALAGDIIGFSRSYLTIMDAIALQLTSIAVSFVASIIIIGVIAPILLLPLTILTVLVVYDNLTSLQRRADHRNLRKKLQSELNGSVADVIGNQILVKVFGKEMEENAAITAQRQKIEDVARREIDIIQYHARRRQLILFVFQVLTLVLCVWLSVNNFISIAALIFTITYLGRVATSLFGISGAIRSIENGFLDATPIIKILSEPVDVVDTPGAKPFMMTQSTIELRNISFRYKDNTIDSVFKHMNLSIADGQHVGLAGKSGGGKSTLLQLLLRFSDIEEGTITISGQDISEVTQKSLRKAIAYVPQDPFLFHRSLRENIAYGKEDATDEEILRALKDANASEFIDKLPNGLDTVVGERGIKLSGGQRQRIAIARAFLKDASIILLDEATSALDSESEILIQRALEKLMQGRTSIVIAHRLSTIAKLDRIIVLDEGKIVEDGTHKELLANKATYARLWNHQSGGFIED